MTDRVVDVPVAVRDNGIRSFVPPTFCFELRAVDNQLVDTVSQLLVVAETQKGLRDFDVLALLDRFGLLALGRISEYDAGPEAMVPGKRFLVDRCMNR